jgi:dihydrofolate synthase/folylpolyglutamate synthase
VNETSINTFVYGIYNSQYVRLGENSKIMTTPFTFTEAVQYINNLINYETQRPDSYTSNIISLERPRKLLHLLDNPHEKYKIIHVAGTKGKGSVSAMCASILKSCGYTVGFFSSPHLQNFLERFRVNDEMISEYMFTLLVNQMKPFIEQVPGITVFEVITVLALFYFYKAHTNIVVLEVGMGGRLDATNIVTPIVSVITSISFDHMNLLGNTLSQIAFEKAGIIKYNIPVVSAPQPEEALTVIINKAKEQRSDLYVIDQVSKFNFGHADLSGQSFEANILGTGMKEYCIPLLGKHQVINAVTALTAIQIASKYGIIISFDKISKGIRSTMWPGRMEIVKYKDQTIVIDGAHNVSSASYLAETLKNLFPSKSVILIFGAFSDKDVEGMFEHLLPLSSRLILLKLDNPRAYNQEILYNFAKQTKYSGVIEKIDIAFDAIEHATNICTSEHIICATGSLSIVGDIRTALSIF